MVLTEKIIDIAINKGASDIHLVNGLKPILRITRDLVEIKEIEPLDEETLYDIYDFIIKGNVISDDMYKEDRKLDTSLEYKDRRLRVNVSFSMNIPTITMRIIPKELPKFNDLGLPEVVRSLTYLPQGLILVTGRTNSGKSTTLSSLIEEINEKQNKKILSLESPIEYKHASKRSIIVQKEVGPGKDCLTYLDGVKNALREDCDILIIGEIRDKETMEAAIDMAESGHLVIGTLHTKSCAETIDRIINFYDINDQAQIKNLLSTILKAVISQRLLKSNENKDDLVMVPEVMIVDSVVAACIRKDKFSVSEIEDAIQGGRDKGSISLISSLANLYVKGKLSKEQIMSQVDEKNQDTLNRTIMQLKH